MAAFVLKFAIFIGALGLVLLALWWRARRRARAAAPETAQAAPPRHQNCRCTVVYDADPPQPEDVSAAADEFCRAMAQSPEPPAVEVTSTPEDVKAGRFCAVLSLPASQRRVTPLGLEYVSRTVPVVDIPQERCLSCGRRPPKHRHNCASKRRS